jgi:tRNA(Ile)-lysidine synthetase-like protein
MDLLPDFQRAIKAFDILHAGDAVVIGVSGGPDSLALLHLFVRSRETLGWRPYILHLNHQIRGSEAEADARFVASIAAEWDVPCRVEQVNVPAVAARSKLSLEEAARQVRYAALAREAERVGANVMAVGHNADDQAETVLMHLLRGSGSAGLRGMLPLTVHSRTQDNTPLYLLRPLLGTTRAAIEAYCAAQGLSPRTDRSNFDTTYSRNRLRHEIIPLLKTVSPNLILLLGHTASVIAADYEILLMQAEEAWRSVVREETNRRVCFELEGWRSLPLALQRATIRRAVSLLRACLRDLGYIHIEEAVRVGQAGQTGMQVTLPGGLVLRVEYDTLVIAPADTHPPQPDWPLIGPGTIMPIAGEGEYRLPGTDWFFGLHPYNGRRSGQSWEALLADIWATPLDADAVAHSGPLQIRTRQAGDRFRPQGAKGAQKLSDFMINSKIPSVWRDQLPLLTAGDQIVWVCGWRVDERFIVRPQTQHVWIACLEKGQGGTELP